MKNLRDKLPQNKKPLIIIAVVVLVLVVGGVVLFLVNANKKQTSTSTSTGVNPVVESYKDQLPQLASLVAQNSTDVKAIRNYAVALYATGDLEKAKTEYEAELALNPNDPVLYNNLGNVYRDSGEYQKAVDSYQKSIDLDQGQLNAYVNLANLYIYVLQQPDLGYSVYLKGTENSPNNKETLLLQLGNAYKDAGLKDKAIDIYNQILAMDPSNTTVKNILSSLK